MRSLKELERRLGPSRPTERGWIQFHHAACGDHKFRLGICLSDGRVRCFHCGLKTHLRTILSVSGDAAADLLRGVRIPGPRHVAAPPPAFAGAPWRRLTTNEPPRHLEKKIREYLEGRGVNYMRASVLGLGYGLGPRWRGRVIFPYYDDEGNLKGWQGRATDDEVEPKMLTASEQDLPGRWTVRHGALYLHDLVPHHPERLVIVEGPFDALSARRLGPTVAILGSEMHEAQALRIKAKAPKEVVLALDRDTYKDRRDEDGFRVKAKMPPIARILVKILRPAPVLVVRYPETFKGDIGGLPDKSPHPEKEIKALFDQAKPWRFGE